MNKTLIFIIWTLLLPAAAWAAPIGMSRDYARVQNFLVDLAKSNPRTTRLFELGQNSRGESILGVKIGEGSVKNLVVATHHGDEYGSTEVALGLAEDLARDPIQGRTIYVIPVLNIPGFNSGRRGELDGNGKTHIDPNRDYPGPCGPTTPFRLRSTRALADFIEREKIVTSATLHTSGAMILYPWGVPADNTATEYERDYQELGRMCTVASDYRIGNSTELLYPAVGSFEDFAYWKYGIWSILFEIGRRRSPDADELRELVRENIPGLRGLLANAPSTRAPKHRLESTCTSQFLGMDLRDE